MAHALDIFEKQVHRDFTIDRECLEAIDMRGFKTKSAV
jgi:hypothetical protein